MSPLIYDRYADWYRLIDPLDDHRKEGEGFAQLLIGHATGEAHTLLELGSGAGNNAFYMKPFFQQCTLTDLSPAMLEQSRTINPECTHIPGDMRTLELNQTFDAILLHDAVTFMLSEQDLRQVAGTVHRHLRVGGAALITPDCLRESFCDSTDFHEAEDGDRSLRGVEWTYDPDPTDTLYTIDFIFLLKRGKEVEAVHDRHIEGLFPKDTWTSIFAEAGFSTQWLPHPEAQEIGPPFAGEMLLCRKP